jgi:hypothetical protein
MNAMKRKGKTEPKEESTELKEDVSEREVLGKEEKEESEKPKDDPSRFLEDRSSLWMGVIMAHLCLGSILTSILMFSVTVTGIEDIWFLIPELAVLWLLMRLLYPPRSPRRGLIGLVVTPISFVFLSFYALHAQVVFWKCALDVGILDRLEFVVCEDFFWHSAWVALASSVLAFMGLPTLFVFALEWKQLEYWNAQLQRVWVSLLSVPVLGAILQSKHFPQLVGPALAVCVFGTMFLLVNK